MSSVRVLLFCRSKAWPHCGQRCRSARKSTRGGLPSTRVARAVLAPGQPAWRACASTRVSRLQSPFFGAAGQIEAVEDGLHLRQGDGRGVALQAPGDLRGQGAAMAREHQQHRNDRDRLQRGRRSGEALLAGLQLAVALGAGAEIDIEAGEALAAGAPVAHRGEREGMHGHVEEGAEFGIGPAVIGFAEQAQDGGREGAVAGEVDIAEGEQTEAIEAGGVAVGIEAAVVVVAAQVADLPQIAEGSPARDLAESRLDLLERDGGGGSEQRHERCGGAAGHSVPVCMTAPDGAYAVTELTPESGG